MRREKKEKVEKRRTARMAHQPKRSLPERGLSLLCAALMAVVVILGNMIAPNVSASEQVLTCSLGEHTHGEGCYQDSFMCVQEEHIHGDGCWSENQELLCGREEHAHGEGCHARVLACYQEEHIHSADCYTVVETTYPQEGMEPETERPQPQEGMKPETERPQPQEEIEPETETMQVTPEIPAQADTAQEIVQISSEMELSDLFTDEIQPPASGQETTDSVNNVSAEETDAAVNEMENADIWQQSVQSVALSGNYAKDLVEIAKTQIGNTENRENFIVNEEGTVQYYSRYGQWYGDPYAEWSAMFVSFCASYAGIPEVYLPGEKDNSMWIGKLGSFYIGKDSYVPQAGDFVFFSENLHKEGTTQLQSGSPAHVGIVVGADEENIYTIEGNTGGVVGCQQYGMNEPAITGYISMAKVMVMAGMLTEDDISSESEAESETEPGTEAEGEIQSEPGTEAEERIQAEPGTEAEEGIQAEPGTEAEGEIQAEPGTEADDKIQAESGTETDDEIMSEPGTEADDEIILEPGTEVEEEIQSDTENETEEEIQEDTENETEDNWFAVGNSYTVKVSDPYVYTPVTKEAPANNWQVVSGNYFTNRNTTGTVTEDAFTYTYSEDYAVRYKKQVEATGNENEFLIHLTVEPEAKDFNSFLDGATFLAVHNNAADLGEGININSGTSPLHTEEEYVAMGSPANLVRVTIRLKFHGQIYEQARYIDTNKIQNVDNGNVGLWSADANDLNQNGVMDSGEPIALARKGSVSWRAIRDRYTNLIDLSEIDLDQYLTVRRAITYPLTVTDPMGEGITYQDTATPSAGTVDEPDIGTSGILTWNLPETEYISDHRVPVTVGGEPHTYYKNAYTLTYKIHLETYDSCGMDVITREAVDANPVSTNGTTTLKYRVDKIEQGRETMVTPGEEQNTEFVIPEVKGLKYEIKLKKVDADHPTLSLNGAIFGLYRDEDCTDFITSAASEQIGEEEGIADFTDLMPGIYFVKEIEAPEGYRMDDETVRTYLLSYTQNKDRLTGQGMGEEALYDDTGIVFTNTYAGKQVKVCKIDYKTETGLNGSKFQLYQVDPEGTDMIGGERVRLIKEYDSGTVGGQDGILFEETLPLGKYYLKEVKAPEGYTLLSHEIAFEVTLEEVRLNDAMAGLSSDTEDEVTVYTIRVKNLELYSLPSTGGKGIYWYLISGTLLMMAASLIVYKRKCREVLKR